MGREPGPTMLAGRLGARRPFSENFSVKFVVNQGHSRVDSPHVPEGCCVVHLPMTDSVGVGPLLTDPPREQLPELGRARHQPSLASKAAPVTRCDSPRCTFFLWTHKGHRFA